MADIIDENLPSLDEGGENEQSPSSSDFFGNEERDQIEAPSTESEVSSLIVIRMILTLSFIIDGHIDGNFDHALTPHACRDAWSLSQEIEAQVLIRGWSDSSRRHLGRLPVSDLQFRDLYD